MTFCKNCGKETSASDKFCQSCGIALSEPTSQVIPENNPTARTSTRSFNQSDRYPTENIGTAEPYKNARNAKYLSIIAGFFGVLGVGHFYIGQAVRGIAFLASGLTLAAISLYFLASGNLAGSLAPDVIYIPIWIWSIVDVSKQASEFNRVLHESKRKLW